MREAAFSGRYNMEKKRGVASGVLKLRRERGRKGGGKKKNERRREYIKKNSTGEKTWTRRTEKEGDLAIF